MVRKKDRRAHWRALAAVAAIPLALAVFAAPAAADGNVTLHESGPECRTAVSHPVGLFADGAGELHVSRGPGPIVDAYLEWVGADDLTPQALTGGDRADSELTVNGVTVVGKQSAGDAGVALEASNGPWYSWSADVGPNGTGLVTTPDATTLAISGWDTINDEYTNGAALVVVYELPGCTTPNLVVVRTGVDFYYFDAPNLAQFSNAMTYQFAPSHVDRVALFDLNHAGTDSRQSDCRGDALWMSAGTGAPPTNIAETAPGGSVGINGGVEILDDPFGSERLPCTLEVNPDPDVAYPADHPFPGGAKTAPYRAVDIAKVYIPEWTALKARVLIPAGAEWVVFQAESEPEQSGESGASVGGGPFVLPVPSVPIDVELDKTIDGSKATPVVAVGDIVSFELTVSAKSTGPDGSALADATGVVVTDVLPAGVRYVGHTRTENYDPVSGVWAVGNLARGTSRTLVITTEILAGPPAETNLAQVTSHTESDIDSTPDNGNIGEDDDSSVSLRRTGDVSPTTVVNATTSIPETSAPTTAAPTTDAGTATTAAVTTTQPGSTLADTGAESRDLSETAGLVIAIGLVLVMMSFVIAQISRRPEAHNIG
ncbi:MAG: putative repeat protein (TIGR01451 family) [Candidatus Poriferisodalaceae bacterium]|jgi:uncharacterized repeat protein (TIGR01451 family)